MHRGCLRCFRDRISYKIPPYWRKRSVQVRHHKEPSANNIVEIEVATRARSIEASDCGLEKVEVPSILTCGTLTDLVQQTASMLTGCF